MVCQGCRCFGEATSRGKENKSEGGRQKDGKQRGKKKNVGSEMVGGPWLSGSGRGKSKDPRDKNSKPVEGGAAAGFL